MANLDKIKLIRLLGGEEIMPEILEDNKDGLKVKNPVRVIVVPNKTTTEQAGVGFAAFSNWTKDTEFVLNKSLILATMTPVEEFTSNYSAAFSGVILPDSKLIKP